MSKAMVPIGVIADLVCQEIGDNTGNRKMQVMQYIALGYQQMHLLINQDYSIKSEIIPIDSELQFELPCDFIYETKIGIKRGMNVWTLKLNTDLEKSSSQDSDTNTLNQMNAILNNPIDESYDCYFYNVFENGNYCHGSLGAHGRGICGASYYNIVNGVLNISPFIVPKDGATELIIEYKSDGLSAGLELVPAEAFLALRYYAKAELASEGVNGNNRIMWENQFKTIKRIYNRTKYELIAEIFAR